MKMPDSNTIAELANDVADMRFDELREIAEGRRAELVAQRIQDMSRNEFGDLIAELLERDIEFVNCLKAIGSVLNRSDIMVVSGSGKDITKAMILLSAERAAKLIHDSADFIYGDECVEEEAERLGREG